MRNAVSLPPHGGDALCRTAPCPEQRAGARQRIPRAFDPENGEDLSKPIPPEDLFGWGCAARILDISKTNSQERRLTQTTYLVTLEGIARFKVLEVTRNTPFLEASVKLFLEPEVPKGDMELQALVMSLRQAGNVLSQLREMLGSTPAGQLADLFSSMIDLTLEEKLDILETVELKPRIEKVVSLINRQVQVFKISQKLQSTIENKLGKKQREFLLREQLEAIKKELGETDGGDGDDDAGDLAKRLADAKLPEDAQRAAQTELKRLKRMNPGMAEYQVIRTYLEWIIELPWSKATADNLDVTSSRGVLDSDHHGLDRVKTRIIEYLAVRKLKKDLRGPILCFVGPPGVGKTSLGRSIANALGRKFYRISLGGVRDEAEIRGHRRTYIGSLPGLIIQGLRRCGVNNPVFLLDEIDKLGRDFRGDPSSALLEVLDPEQNSTFSDHYLNIPFDLSNVLFIATANELDTVPAPLLDRMEIIQIPGYTFDEKLSIAKRYLLPKQIAAHGLDSGSISMADDVILKIATGYTHEAGVRSLEREIGAVCRFLAVEYSQAKESGREALFDGKVTQATLENILGAERYDDEIAERMGVPGVVTGLAYTSSGSGGLLFIEATATPGKGTLHLTGKLGDVIKESAQIGLTWVRANASKLGIQSAHKNVFEDTDVHIHFPAGAVPKDGPSAGVTIVTALVSLMTGSLVREHTAMTGEVTLRGQVLPVGGIKEKVLAAHRAGVNRIILPLRNQKDVQADIPHNVKGDIEFVYAKTLWDVLRAAFPLNTRYLQIGDDPAHPAARL
nr:hypothetical protein HK105_005101 [Polyrhizophydium stewartii]